MAVQAHLKEESPSHVDGDMYVAKDAGKWAVDPEKEASGFYDVYYRKLLDKVWAGGGLRVLGKLIQVDTCLRPYLAIASRSVAIPSSICFRSSKATGFARYPSMPAFMHFSLSPARA